ncbi:TetR/AcrR family transcriptional regulator [Nocardioides sp. YIM 152588]|uniref:TetR/AcrR family transcriptional regulator n=1 Tax=Nocardioides sp. YIM 152588 TaxID=3158259 RepID=UPI0032E4B26B
MARKRVDLRREEIIEAMIEQMRSRGIAETRVVDVAKALDVSTGLIFYHFDTKEALLLAAFPRAMERDLEDLDRIVARRSTAMRRLKALIKLYGPDGDAEGWRLWIDGWGNSLRDDSLAKSIQQIDDRWRTAVRTLIEQGVEAGEFTCADPVATAARITAILDGLAVQKVVRRDTLTKATYDSWVEQLLQAELVAV